MAALLRQNIAVFDDMGVGQFVSQLGAGMNIIQDSLSQKLPITPSALETLPVTYVASLVLYWKLAFMLIWAFFLGLGLLHLGNRVTVRYSGRSLEAKSAGTSLVEDTLGFIRSATALGIQKHVLPSRLDHGLCRVLGAGEKFYRKAAHAFLPASARPHTL